MKKQKKRNEVRTYCFYSLALGYEANLNVLMKFDFEINCFLTDFDQTTFMC